MLKSFSGTGILERRAFPAAMVPTATALFTVSPCIIATEKPAAKQSPAPDVFSKEIFSGNCAWN